LIKKNLIHLTQTLNAPPEGTMTETDKSMI
jgi:hypothetical protein